MPDRGTGNAPEVLIRGGGDLATGVVWRLHRAGFQVLVTELGDPLTVRRTVSVSSAVRSGTVTVEGMTARLVENVTGGFNGTEMVEALAQCYSADEIPVVVSAGIPDLRCPIVVDARLAKRNLDTRIDDGEFVVALGPGFHAGKDCDAVVETMRGHRLGRVLWSGEAIPNTGLPGEIGGKSGQRVLRSPGDGHIDWLVEIGDSVQSDQAIGMLGDRVVAAPFTGVVRGLIHPSTPVRLGMKIGDIDPRTDLFGSSRSGGVGDVHLISDKALAVGGGVLEAVMTWKCRRYVRHG